MTVLQVTCRTLHQTERLPASCLHTLPQRATLFRMLFHLLRALGLVLLLVPSCENAACGLHDSLGRAPASWPSAYLPHNLPLAGFLDGCKTNRSACPRPAQALSVDSGPATAPWWDRVAAARAGLLSSSPSSWLPLLRKARAGLPVTVLALAAASSKAAPAASPPPLKPSTQRAC